MLVLTVNPGRKVYVGDDIIIYNRQKRSYKLYIEAPDDVKILRGELLERNQNGIIRNTRISE